jgi:hypothetical protein
MSHEPKKFPMEIQEVARERTLSRPRTVNSPSSEDDQVVVNEAEAQAERDDLGARGHLHPGAAFGGAEAREGAVSQISKTVICAAKKGILPIG